MALNRMAEDFRWIMNQSDQRRLKWTAELSLLVEFVHDVNAHLQLEDDLCRRIPLYRLYDSFSHAVGIPAPKQPAVALNKLRAREMRQDISPDTIIRFYMKQIEKEQAGAFSIGNATSEASPNRDIILCLLRME